MQKLAVPFILLVMGVAACVASYSMAEGWDELLGIYSTPGKIFIGAAGLAVAAFLMLMGQIIFSGLKKPKAPRQAPATAPGDAHQDEPPQSMRAVARPLPAPDIAYEADPDPVRVEAPDPQTMTVPEPAPAVAPSPAPAPPVTLPDEPAAPEDAIRVYGAVLDQPGGIADPALRGTAHERLGDAWRKIGQNDNDPAALTNAVNAYSEAIQDAEAANDPNAWAERQARIGNVFLLLAQQDGSVGDLEAAAAALSASTDPSMIDGAGPKVAARRYRALGEAFLALAKQKGEPALIEKGVTALRNALAALGDTDAPQFSALTQRQLGLALEDLASHRDQDGDLLVEARTAFDVAASAFSNMGQAKQVEKTVRHHDRISRKLQR